MVQPKNQELLLDRASPSQLRKLISPTTDEATAAQALKVLTQSGPREATQLSADIVSNRRFGPTVRSAAAVQLGKSTQPDSEPALLKALGSSERDVLRHVVRAIGRIGGEKALERLSKFEPPEPGPVAEALEFARILTSYRLGSMRFLARPPALSDVRPPDPETAFSLPVQMLSAKRTEPMVENLAIQLPATALSRRNALAVTCGASEYRVLLSAQIDEDTAALLVRPFIAGAIFKYRPCPEHYSLDAYLLSSPRDAASSHIIGMRPSGAIVLAGTATVAEQKVLFEVTTTRSPHFRKLRVVGEVGRAGAFRGLEALVSRELAEDGPRRRPQQRSPLRSDGTSGTSTPAGEGNASTKSPM